MKLYNKFCQCPLLDVIFIRAIRHSRSCEIFPMTKNAFQSHKQQEKKNIIRHARNFSHVDTKKNLQLYFLSKKNEYTDWERPPRSQQLGARDAALELLSDGHTVAPLVRLAYLHSLRGGKSFFMHFNHRTSERDFPQVRNSFNNLSINEFVK